MPSTLSRDKLLQRYEAWAQEYLESLPLEHFMESTAQSTQRQITMASLELVTRERPDVHVFGELLVQYPFPGKKRPRQVVPDNMVVITKDPIVATTCFNLPTETARPFWVLEYVSHSNRRKDYDENFEKYEQDLKIPYYLLFNPDVLQVLLYRFSSSKYVLVKANAQGRFPIPKLNLEVAMLGKWLRFWYKGELLPLPSELMAQNEELQQKIVEEREDRISIEEARKELARENARIKEQLALSQQAAEAEIAHLRAMLKLQHSNGKNGHSKS